MARLSETETKSAHSSTKGTTFIGDFKIDRLRIFTPQREKGSYIELGEGEGAVWSELNFYEDITATVVHGDLTIQEGIGLIESVPLLGDCLLYTSPSPRDLSTSRMPSSA